MIGSIAGAASTVGQIVINTHKLRDAQTKMRRLSSELSNRKLNAYLDQSEGDFANELLRIGAQLQSFGEAFAALTSRCADVLNNTTLKTEEMDRRTAAIFSPTTR